MFNWHQPVSQHIDSNLRLLKVDTCHLGRFHIPEHYFVEDSLGSF